jgi:DNA gyrase subunit A
MGAADEVLLISDGGTLVRTRGSEISRVGRNTQGVTLIRLSKDEKLQAVERMDASIGDDEPVDVVPVAGEAAAAEPAATDEQTPQG